MTKGKMKVRQKGGEECRKSGDRVIAAMEKR